jgi:SAM-dependent methyltransferase
VLDLGCSHGGFVALMRLAGFDAVGMEISPWVLDFARRTFTVPMLRGPIEDADPGAERFDVIVMTDVLEHLADPVGTLRVCADWLSPDGLLLIQTPCFDPAWHFREMETQQAPFLEMMMPDEHLYLFSRRSVARLLEQLGFAHLLELPAMFERYDMFLAARRVPITPVPIEDIEQCLLDRPHGRVALALMDLRRRELEAVDRARIFEADSAARMTQIETLTELLKVAEADRAARGAQIDELTAMLQQRK